MRRRREFTSPARLVPVAFAGTILLGAAVLSIPQLHPGSPSDLMVSIFTATSAVCVTSLAIVDHSTYWTPLGQGVILALIQIGGFGIVTMATLLSLVITRRLGLRTRLSLAAETKSVGSSDVRAVLMRVALTMLVVESAVAFVLALRWWIYYDQPLYRAIWYGVFHSVSAFNNAGFSIFSDNLVGYVGDPWICLPICVGMILGGIGFPVLFELARARSRTVHWSIHTRLTVWTTLVLLAVGTVTMLALEWTNDETLGALSIRDRLLAGLFQGVQPRSAGFNTVVYADMREETLGVQTALMFIGGGSAGTAGGIKITTFMLLAFVILAELRGDTDVVIGRRRIPESVHRQALSVALIAVGVVAVGTFILEIVSPYSLTYVLFEAVSAFATVGLSTGVTASVGPSGQVVLILLMFIGRIGTVTAGSFFALRHREILYRHPPARPLVG